MKKKCIKLPLYKTQVMLYHCDPDEIFALLKKNDYSPTETEGRAGLTLFVDDATIGPSVWIRRSLPKSLAVSILVHEMFHATSKIMRDRGIKLENMSNEETFAYLLEHLITESLPFIESKPKKGTKL